MDDRKMKEEVCFKYFTVKCNNSFSNQGRKYGPYICAYILVVEKGLKKMRKLEVEIYIIRKESWRKMASILIANFLSWISKIRSLPFELFFLKG